VIVMVFLANGRTLIRNIAARKETWKCFFHQASQSRVEFAGILVSSSPKHHILVASHRLDQDVE
jgi:hypothetical protein